MPASYLIRVIESTEVVCTDSIVRRSRSGLAVWRGSVVRPVRLCLTFLGNRITIYASPTTHETILGIPRSSSQIIRATVELVASKESSALYTARVGAQADQHTPHSTPVHDNYTTAFSTASRHLRRSLPPADRSPSPRRARRQPTSLRPVHDDRTRAAGSTLNAPSTSRLPDRTR